MVGITRRALGALTATALLASAFVGTSAQAQGTAVHDGAKTHEFDWGTFTLAQRIIDKVAAGEPLNIVIDNQGTAIPVFGAEQRIGTERGCANNATGLAAVCSLKGPASTDATAQLSELQALLAADQVDCLGMESPQGAFLDLINQYVDEGIPVFTQNTDVPDSKRFAFYALNEREAGHINGVTTANLVKAQGLDIKTIGMGSGGPSDMWAQNRMGGFLEGYTSVFPDATFAQDEKTGLPVGAPDYTIQQAQDQVGPYLQGNAEVNLFFHTDQGVEGVATVIDQQGKTGQVWTSGFNVDLPILDYIDKGVILVTINQGFDNQAEAAVNACLDFLANGVLSENELAYSQPIIITKDGGEGMQSSAEARELLLKVLGG